MTDRLPHASEALRSRARRGVARASRGRETVEEPRRRWGRQTGIRGVWGLGVAGRHVFLTRSTAHRERAERGLEVGRELVQRGLQTPVTRTPDGAPGLRTALEALWPQSLRRRGWLHQRQPLPAPSAPPGVARVHSVGSGPAGGADL